MPALILAAALGLVLLAGAARAEFGGVAVAYDVTNTDDGYYGWYLNVTALERLTGMQTPVPLRVNGGIRLETAASFEIVGLELGLDAYKDVRGFDLAAGLAYNESSFYLPGSDDTAATGQMIVVGLELSRQVSDMDMKAYIRMEAMAGGYTPTVNFRSQLSAARFAAHAVQAGMKLMF